MFSNPTGAPPPELRIVNVDDVQPHETGDIQRTQPLMTRLREAALFTNPPVVAAIAGGGYVLMDGSNRHMAMKRLGFAHILVQIADYEAEHVELGVWQHVVADWDARQFMGALEGVEAIELRAGWDSSAVAQALLREGPVHSIHARADSLAERNAALRQVVEAYHSSAPLFRSPLTNAARIWSLFPSGVALVMFRGYEPADIIAAAVDGALMPPGVTRHIIHGRALNLNYPMARLRAELPLAEKNQQLQDWLRQRFRQRGVRFYAEATYHFDE